MSIIIGRHAQRQMKWRKIDETEVKATIADPDMLQNAIKERTKAFKTLGGHLLKVTYYPKVMTLLL